MTQVDLLKKYGLSVRGRLGQHILIDANTCRKIVGALELQPGDRVLEIGPGLGALTGEILDSGCHLAAVEKDPQFARVLEQELKPKFGKQFELFCADFLEFDFAEQCGKTQGTWKVISNLPYYVTAPILFRLFDQHVFFSKAILMMQKEVAKRLTANPGTKDYGRLTVGCQYFSRMRHVMDVSPSCFTPKPQVDSSVVELTFKPAAERLSKSDEERLFKLVRTAFSQRRKTLFHLLSRDEELCKTREIAAQAFEKLGLEPKIRGEALNLEQFIALSRQLG
ncbi:MAG: ribosomal RNA small subunit methyltransferase A [Candidatus Omnitrophica bacterium]|nr:ribosomal RNA small subunit methyltransferase A [Candidatus Omnitrophota bacterium]